jgi:NADH-quinone oxidoreductase subunit G
VVFPAESYAEKEGTVTHPDGRVQRLRPAIGRPGEVRMGWQVIVELTRRLGLEGPHPLVGPMATKQLVDAVPFYAGLTLEELAGHGVRWPEREAAAAFPAFDRGPFQLETPPPAAEPNGALRLGTFRSIWSGPEVAASPALKFLVPRKHVEMAPADAQRLGLQHGDAVTVGSNGHRVEGVVHLRGATPEGSIFVETSGADGELVEVTRR